MTGQPLRIGVIGGGSCDAETAGVARQVGELIAAAGAVLVCGGRGGVMQAAAEGARDAGGLTVGILPGEDPAAANPGIVVAIPTGLGDARNAVVVNASHAVIAIGGAWGTLSEAAFCIKKGVPLIRLRSDLPDLPVPTAAAPQEAVEWALREGQRVRAG
ncbi:MAG TPA: TIGR00725 family protein [Gemmatimonadota bacterium]|nr:TIGR00725 family protein [Gemmatimonadota bacterium]